MALTRKSLKGMQLTDEQVESIIEMHTESVNALKDDIDKYKQEAEKYADIEQKLKEANEKISGYEAEAKKDKPFEKKYTDLKAEFDSYKTGVEEKESKAAKESAVKAYFESKNIKGNNLNLALKVAKDEISEIELDEGKIKDVTALDTLIAGDLSGLVANIKTVGADVKKPPENNGGTEKTESRAAKLAAQYHANLYGERGE